MCSVLARIFFIRFILDVMKYLYEETIAVVFLSSLGWFATYRPGAVLFHICKLLSQPIWLPNGVCDGMYGICAQFSDSFIG